MLSEFFKIKFFVCIVFSFYPRQGLCGLFCPMCLLCDISGRMGEGCAYASCCCEVAPLTLRAKLRAEQRIQVRNSFAATCTPVIQAWGWGRGVRNTLSRKGTFLIRSWAGVFSNFLAKKVVALHFLKWFDAWPFTNNRSKSFHPPPPIQHKKKRKLK